jgi:hypothetical protein
MPHGGYCEAVWYTAFQNNYSLWLWVPAFAGTTASIQPNLNESLIHPTIAAAPRRVFRDVPLWP